MAIVLLVSVLLSAALTSMFFALSSATKLTSKNLGTRRAQYICDGVVALAGFELRRASVRSTTLDALDTALDPLRAGIIADGVIIDELRANASGSARRTVVPSGGLAGMEVSVVDLDLRIALRSPEAPPCRARHVQPLASLAFFQFPAFSVDAAAITPGPNVDVRVPGRGGYVWGKSSANAGAGLQGRDMRSAPLTLPEAPDHITPVPTDLRFLLQRPGTGFPASVPTPTAELLNNRLAFAADLRIIDGEWYVRDPADDNAWPGLAVWSDHPCTNAVSVGACSNVVGSSDGQWLNDSVVRRRLYSRYERNGNGFLDASGGAGVVSYGSITGSSDVDAFEPAGFQATELCANDPLGFRKPAACTPKDPLKDGPRVALADAARAGFRDPHLDLPRTPINIDVGLLGTAMQTIGQGELGDVLCLPRGPGDPGTCRRVFNGVVYISSTHGSPGTAPPSFTAPIAPIPSDPRVGVKLPWPLCGQLSGDQNSLETGEDATGYFNIDVEHGCDDADFAQIDSVRLLRAFDLSAFANTGLTIVTDLPVYLQGDWNVAGVTAGARTAIMAERVTVMSAKFTDLFAPPLGTVAFPPPPPPPPPPTTPPTPPPPPDPALATPTVTMRGSILAGNVVVDVIGLVRVIEPSVNVTVEGSLATAFTSTVVADDHRPGKFGWSYPDALFSGAPTEQPPGTPRATFVLPGARRP
jgi:hypothetical protein